MKLIPNLKGYAVDTRGRVWSLHPGRYNRWKKPHLLSVWTDRWGYLHVPTRDGERRTRYPIHVLVARTFLGERPPGTVISHIDGDKSNNRPSNLRYVTQKQNIAQKVLHGTYICGDDDCKAKVTDAQCQKMLELMRDGRMTQRAIARRFGVSECHVSALKLGRIRKHLTQSTHHKYKPTR